MRGFFIEAPGGVLAALNVGYHFVLSGHDICYLMYGILKDKHT